MVRMQRKGNRGCVFVPLEFVRYSLLFLLIGLMAFSSHPTIVGISHASGISHGSILSKYINPVFVLLAIMCLTNKSFLKCKTFLFSGAVVFFIFLYYLITVASFGKDLMLEDARAILLSLLAMVIGWQLNFDRKKLYRVLLAYAGLVLYVGLMQVITNIGGFVILDLYKSDNKNALGVMLSTSAIIFVFVRLNWNGVGWVRFVSLVAAFLTILVLLTIRARTATLSCGLILLYVFFERYKKRNLGIHLIIGVALIAILYIIMPEFAKEYIHNSFFQHFEDQDITTNRLSRNEAGLRFISQHFWVGNLNANATLYWIHNYPLEKMYKYGIIFSFPILLIYLYLLIVSIKKSAKADNRNIDNIGFYLLLVPYIVSMAEPTFPFGPGTATIFNFIVFGNSLRKNHDEYEYHYHRLW